QRNSGTWVHYELDITDEDPGTEGTVLSSGRFAGYLYTTAGGRWALRVWRPDLDLSPNEGESILYDIGPSSSCLYRPKLIGLDQERVFFAYELDSQCGLGDAPPIPRVDGFACSDST